MCRWASRNQLSTRDDTVHKKEIQKESTIVSSPHPPLTPRPRFSTLEVLYHNSNHESTQSTANKYMNRSKEKVGNRKLTKSYQQ